MAKRKSADQPVTEADTEAYARRVARVAQAFQDAEQASAQEGADENYPHDGSGPGHQARVFLAMFEAALADDEEPAE